MIFMVPFISSHHSAWSAIIPIRPIRDIGITITGLPRILQYAITVYLHYIIGPQSPVVEPEIVNRTTPSWAWSCDYARHAEHARQADMLVTLNDHMSP